MKEPFIRQESDIPLMAGVVPIVLLYLGLLGAYAYLVVWSGPLWVVLLLVVVSMMPLLVYVDMVKEIRELDEMRAGME